ncbi:hypothetical protein G6F62_014521 [Rhizopus arrhizus]|nr:hypothetical protein G6F62_014521 [Rhizopus arrhizus]
MISGQRTDGDQVAVGRVGRHQPLQLADAQAPRLVGDFRDHAADRRFDVDGRVQATVGDAARQQDVAVEDRARRIGDRILRIVALGQHRVERGDRAAALGTVARAFNQRWQLGEHRRRVAAGGWCESISSSTFKPWSRNHSAMAVAR